MPLIPLPSTHRQVDGGLAAVTAGRNLLAPSASDTVWCWDQATGEQVTDLYDQDGNPCTTLPLVRNCWAGGVPKTVTRPEFSVTRDGARLPGSDWAQTANAEAARDAAEVAAQRAADAAGSVSPINYDTDGVPYLTDLASDLIAYDTDGVPYIAL